MIDIKIEYGVAECDISGSSQVIAIDTVCLIHALYDTIKDKDELAANFVLERIHNFDEDRQEMAESRIKVQKTDENLRLVNQIKELRKEKDNG